MAEKDKRAQEDIRGVIAVYPVLDLDYLPRRKRVEPVFRVATAQLGAFLAAQFAGASKEVARQVTLYLRRCPYSVFSYLPPNEEEKDQLRVSDMVFKIAGDGLTSFARQQAGENWGKEQVWMPWPHKRIVLPFDRRLGTYFIPTGGDGKILVGYHPVPTIRPYGGASELVAAMKGAEGKGSVLPRMVREREEARFKENEIEEISGEAGLHKRRSRDESRMRSFRSSKPRVGR